MHQERNYPARVYATELVNPDFAASPKPTERSRECDLTRNSLPRWKRTGAGHPSFLAQTDPQAITMSATIDQIRAQTRPGRNERRLRSPKTSKDGAATAAGPSASSQLASPLLEVEHRRSIPQHRSGWSRQCARRILRLAAATVAIVGESGSGKSVTALSLMRLVEHGGGTITAGRMGFARDDGAESISRSRPSDHAPGPRRDRHDLSGR